MQLTTRRLIRAVQRASLWQRVVCGIWLVVLLLLVFMLAYPICHRPGQLFIVIAIPLLWLSAIFLCRKRQMILFHLLLYGIAITFFLCLPGRRPDPGRLRNFYVGSLLGFEGTGYLWGGENCFGVDCSGLVRRGLINAHFELGLRTLNPQAIRTAFSLWWHGCSAEALRDEYRGVTCPLFKAESINAISSDHIKPGDIAVTLDGIHVLAYLGQDEWIEADPGLLRVVKLAVPNDNPWFNESVLVMRWASLCTVMP